MGVERGNGRTASVASPYVTKRLCTTIVLSFGILCIVGGFLLGNMARNEIKRRNDIVSFNLTILAENLFKKAKKITPKAVLHNDPEKIAAKLSDMFHCTQSECGSMTRNIDNIAQFVKNAINVQVIKLMKSISNASVYLDSLR